MKRLTYVLGMLALTLAAGCGGQKKDAPKQPPTEPAPKGAEAPQPAPVAKLAVGWRGDGAGRYPQATPPLEWDVDAKKNVVWTTKIGANRYSSAAFCDGKVFVTAEPADLVCVDAATGKILWRKTTSFADLPVKMEEVPARGDPGNTTPTPVCDGESVYALFGCGLVACYDLQGQRKWIQYVDNGPNMPQYGRSASPVLVADKLVVSISCLAALDAKTGKQAWKNEDVPELYGTPVPVRVGGTDMVIAPSGHIVRVSDGVILAETQELKYASPILQDSVVYMIDVACSAWQLPTDAEAKTQLAQTPPKLRLKKLWDTEIEGVFYDTAVYHDGQIYDLSNEGKLYVLNAKDGKPVWDKEMEIPNGSGRPDMPPANIYPSPTIAGKYLFLSNDIGDVFILEPGKEYKEVKRNKVPEGSGGTPVFVGKRVYLRGGENLYCIGE